MALDPITALLTVGNTIIDKIFPDPVGREKAKIELLKLQQEGQFKELEARFSAIVAEAQSQDRWTSRARPSFLYVIYIMILMAIPMGFLYAFQPETAHHIALGLQEWLKAIPDSLYTLFGAGYLGYAGARSYDKKTIVSNK